MDLARISGRSPWEAANDPHLSFNAMVMRTARRSRLRRVERALQGVKHSEQAVAVLLGMLVEGS